MQAQIDKFERFRALHHQEAPLVVANPWDAGSARLLSDLGFAALATTSAGHAFSVGKRDSFDSLTRQQVLDNATAIVAATDLPVTADLEDGFGADPRTCAETIVLASGTGLIGGSIEDATGDPAEPIHSLERAVERIRAAAEAARGRPFLLTARVENHLWGRHDLHDTIARLQAYAEAGADVLFAPGLPGIDAIRTVCAEVGKPVNVVMGLRPPYYSVQELSDAGVRRISVGGSFARAALGGLRRAAMEVIRDGTFGYVADAITGEDLLRIMQPGQLSHRE